MASIIYFYIRTLPTRLLQFLFRFDRWHIYGSSKPEYVKIVANLVNDLGDNLSVVEVGCGLGNIISKIKSTRKVGLDLDNKVIRAAKLTQGFKFKAFKVLFKQGSFSEALKLSPDVLIAVNFIHNIPIENLLAELTPFTDEDALVVIDAIESYKFYHSEQILSLYFKVKLVGVVGQEKRHIFLLGRK